MLCEFICYIGVKRFFPMDVLDTYAQNGSLLLSHSSHKIPGVEISGGSLGHVFCLFVVDSLRS